MRSKACWILWISKASAFPSLCPQGGQWRTSTWQTQLFSVLKLLSTVQLFFSLMNNYLLSYVVIDLERSPCPSRCWQRQPHSLLVGTMDFALTWMAQCCSHCDLIARSALNINVTLCIRAALLWISLELQIKSYCEMYHDVSLHSSVSEIVRCQHWALEILVYWSMSPAWKSSIPKGKAAEHCRTWEDFNTCMLVSTKRCLKAKGTHHDPSSQFFSSRFSTCFSV